MDVIELTSYVVLYLLMTVAVLYDFKHTRISNRLIVTGLIIALILRLLGDGVEQFVWIFPNILFPVVVLYLLYLARVLGAGDIKLFSLIGGFLNFKELVGCMCISFICAAICALIYLIYSGKLRSRITRGLLYIASAATGNLYPYEVERGDEILHFSLYEMCGVTAVLVYKFLGN